MTESSPDESNSERKNFFCGVVEGFYGRPWTTEQRKDLFQKLKKWSMDMYVYAPKDDYKHRAYWRELYTVEEAEHLTSLISAAKAQGITFCYALSPGLDITYSSQKEISILKRKLEQVSQFGCTCFALLFDDIEPEMSEADKQTFQSFAHAQVSVTNEVHQHLGCPKFLLCPTQYCATRAVPTVNSSEYLNTLGTKLSQEIDIMWTGPKVISKTLTTECIEEITQVLRRPPVIWDNLHANDYDQKRIFLGPYCGRSPELIPLLRGVLTNPNCEYNANMIPIWTLAHWAKCRLDAPPHMESVSWDIKLEREGEQGVYEDEVPLCLGKHVYHHRQALRYVAPVLEMVGVTMLPQYHRKLAASRAWNLYQQYREAINEWLPEFSIPKTAQGPVIKPQPPPVPPVPIIPIIPSVNTCMSLVSMTATTTTTSVQAAAIPTVNPLQLQALADVCSTPDRPIVSTGISSETFNPVPNPVMNSLVSPTKVILNESIPNPIIPMANIAVPSEIPVSTIPAPVLGLKNIDSDQIMDKNDETLVNDSVLEGESFLEETEKKMKDEDIVVDDDTQHNGEMSIGDTPQTLSPLRASGTELELDVDLTSNNVTDDVPMNDVISENSSMQVEASHSPLSTDMMVEPAENDSVEVDTSGSSAMTHEEVVLLCDLFYLPFCHGGRGLRLLHDFHWLLNNARRPDSPEFSEWRRRKTRFCWWWNRVRRVHKRLSLCANRELYAELHPYVWELCAVLSLLHGFLTWLELGKFPPNMTSYMQGSYTWFSKGWREAFESGAQEPWVFRGGLTSELRRLLPVQCGDLARLAPPPRAPLAPRVAAPSDHAQICEICLKTYCDGGDASDLFPSDLQSLPADRLVMPFLTLEPDLCMVLEDDHELDGFEEDNSENRINGLKPEIVGYACAALDSKEFYRKMEMAWFPEMETKYPKELLDREDLSPVAKECIGAVRGTEGPPAGVLSAHGAVLTTAVMADTGARDPAAHRRLITALLAAVKAKGGTGVHACIAESDSCSLQFYSKLGFVELARGARGELYLGRTF